jgi:putative transposase
MKKAFRYRIYPKKNQEVKMDRTLSTCRHLYNDNLAERKRQAELNNLRLGFDVFPWGYPEWIRYKDQANALPGSKTDFQKEVHAQVLQNVLKRLDKSYKNFFKGFGYPRFKGRNRYNSFTYPQKGFELKDGALYLSKIGTVRIFQHRELEGTIKTCTIKKEVDQWYAIFTVEIDIPIKKVPIVTTTGVDVGLDDLLTLKNGEKIEPPKFYRNSEQKLAQEQRRLSNKKLGSNNRKKQVSIVAKVHRKIRNQRKDFNQKTSRWLVNSYDYIAFEDLQINNMVKNHRLAKSILDASWGQIIRFTAYKAAYAGKTVELVDPYGTSQTCLCGADVPKDLSVRIHTCPECGLIMNRDQVSAILIERKGTLYVPTDCRELTPVESLNRDSWKQEAPLL